MKNIKKRLPALLLALVIAVMPLMLAVPVSAVSVFDGPCDSSVYYLVDNTVLPGAFLDGVEVSSLGRFILIRSYNGFWYLQIFDDVPSSIYYSTAASDEYLIVEFASPYSGYYFKGSFDDGSFVWSSPLVLNSSANSVSCYYDISDGPYWAYNVSSSLITDVSDYISFFNVQSVSFQGTGVLSVFSGVGSWLAGAVNNMVSMFWTAEGGLSVLGVLALASLAIAFVILIVYLLAGWLRFK